MDLDFFKNPLSLNKNIQKITKKLYKLHPSFWELKYFRKDPWGFEGNAGEIFRRNETIRILKDKFPDAKNILEIGCAEGFHTEVLSRTFQHITAIDPSLLALKRVKQKNLKNVILIKGSLESELHKYPDKSFDLVIACETLYYLKDIPCALKEISRVGKSCVISFYQSNDLRMQKILQKNLKNNSQEVLNFSKDRHWTVVWWN